MKTGILIHSKTGHTRLVAQELQKALAEKGQPADLLEVRAMNEGARDAASVQLAPLPDLFAYDRLIIGAPVWGGRLSTVMQACLLALPSLEGKELFGFVTQAFPSPSMGGVQALQNLEELCGAKGQTLARTSVVNWMFKKKRARRIAETLRAFTAD